MTFRCLVCQRGTGYMNICLSCNSKPGNKWPDTRACPQSRINDGVACLRIPTQQWVNGLVAPLGKSHRRAGFGDSVRACCSLLPSLSGRLTVCMCVCMSTCLVLYPPCLSIYIQICMMQFFGMKLCSQVWLVRCLSVGACPGNVPYYWFAVGL